MKTTITTLLGLLAVGVLAQDSKLPFGKDGYTWEVPEWQVAVAPGEQPITLNGTVEQVHAQLLQLNPNWDLDFPPAERQKAGNALSVVARGVLGERADFGNSKLECQPRDQIPCDGHHIDEGIAYLRRIRGQPLNQVKRCGRVSCSYNSAIAWCNDGNAAKTLDSYADIADGAQHIRNHCSLDDFPKKHQSSVMGFAEHPSMWSVFVYQDQC